MEMRLWAGRPLLGGLLRGGSMQERDPPESRLPSGSGIQSIAAREDWMKPSRRTARRGLKLTLRSQPRRVVHREGSRRAAAGICAPPCVAMRRRSLMLTSSTPLSGGHIRGPLGIRWASSYVSGLAQLDHVARSSSARASSPARPVKAQCATTIKSVSSLVSLLMP